MESGEALIRTRGAGIAPDAVQPRLYTILGSHACRSAMLMLEHKRLSYRTVLLPTALHPLGLRLAGYAGNPVPFREIDDRRHRVLAMADRLGTVPVLRVGNEWIARNRLIASFLDKVQAEPSLFPDDPERRRDVEEAERWGDEVFQMVARRLGLAAALHGLDGLSNRGGEGRLGPLLWRHQAVRFIGASFVARSTFAANARAEQQLLQAIPAMFDDIDAWIRAGVLGGEELNAADFMIAPSIALLSYRRDLSAEIARRPMLGLIDRLLPEP
jgi:glutathione S-transferase